MAPPPALRPLAGPTLLNLHLLSWGLILLTVWMSILVDAGLSETFAPAPPSPGVPLAEMGPALLALNAVILLTPVACLLLLGAGLAGLHANVPEVRAQLVWRVGPLVLSPLRVVGLLFLGAILAAMVAVAVAFAGLLAGGTAVGTGFLAGAAFEAFLIGIGWCLMVMPALAIRPFSTPLEGKALAAATWVISTAALFEAAVQFVAAAVGESMLATNPNVTGPPSYPWAQGFSALAAVAGLVTVTWIARRVVHRMRRAAAKPAGLPA